MQIKINYFLLFAVISIGVIVGNVISNWLISNYLSKEIETKSTVGSNSPPVESPKPVAPENIEIPKIEEQTLETVKLSPENTVNTEDKATPISTEELIEQRRLDNTGIRLGKKCNEWTIVHEDMNNPSSERGMNKYCNQYYDYVSFGTLPESN